MRANVNPTFVGRENPIRSGLRFLDADLSLALGPEEFRFTQRQWRKSFAADDSENLDRLRREILNSERLRDRARTLLRELEEFHEVSDSDAFSPSLAQLKKAARSAATYQFESPRVLRRLQPLKRWSHEQDE
jgi:hypothetical protein